VSGFLWLVGFRLREAVRRPSAVFVHFGLPLLLLLLTGGLFLHGHPFQRRTLSVIGAAAPEQVATLARFGDLRLSADADAAVARRKLRAGAVHAVLDAGHLVVTGRDELLGRGIQAALGGAVTLEVEPATEYAYLRYLFPGIVTWTILVNGLLGMGYSMAHYRRTGFLRKLRTTPLSRAGFVGAQIVARAALVSLQLALLGGLAHFAFHLPLAPGEALWSAVLAVVGLVVFAGFGFVIASSLPDESTVAEAANVATAVLLLLSEVFFPIDELPRPLALLAEVLPSTALVRLLRGVMLYGETSPGHLLPGLLGLAGWGVAAYAVSVITFRWDA
jgi:ABC-type multidrug transport system permease subunit